MPTFCSSCGAMDGKLLLSKCLFLGILYQLLFILRHCFRNQRLKFILRLYHSLLSLFFFQSLSICSIKVSLLYLRPIQELALLRNMRFLLQLFLLWLLLYLCPLRGLLTFLFLGLHRKLFTLLSSILLKLRHGLDYKL